MIAFQLLAGRLPFQGDSVAELLNLHINTPVPDVLEFRSDTPTFLKQVVEKLLEKKPVNRYQCMDELLLDLESGKIMTNHFPELNKRKCMQCGEDTPADLPFCSFCGFSLSDAISHAGEYQVVRSRGFEQNRKAKKAENEKLKRFITESFELRVRWFEIDRDILIVQVDEFLADLVCKRAWDYVVLLKSEKTTASKTTLAFINTIFRFMGLINHYVYTHYFFISLTRSLTLFEVSALFPALILFASLWFVLLKYCLTARIFPVIGREKIAQSPFMRYAERWKELAGLLKQHRTDDMKPAVAESIALSVMLDKHKSGGVRDDEKSGIYAILNRLVSVANLISSVERSFSKTDRTNLSGKESSEKTEKYTEITDRHGELMNRFFQLRFALNRIAGKTLILKNALDSFEIGDLAKNLETLEKSFRTLEKVRLELEKI